MVDASCMQTNQSAHCVRKCNFAIAVERERRGWNMMKRVKMERGSSGMHIWWISLCHSNNLIVIFIVIINSQQLNDAERKRNTCISCTHLRREKGSDARSNKFECFRLKCIRTSAYTPTALHRFLIYCIHFFQKWNLKSLFCPQKCKTFIEKYTYTHLESILSRQSFTRTAFSLVRKKKLQSTKGNRVSQQHHWKLWLLYVHLTAKPFLSFHVFLRSFQQSTIKRKILRLQRIDVTLSGIAYTCQEKYFDRNISLQEMNIESA